MEHPDLETTQVHLLDAVNEQTTRRSRCAVPSAAGGIAALTVGIALLTAQGAIFKRLAEYGAQYQKETQSKLNPISACNVLFIGNLCATIVNVLLHWKQLTPTALREIARHGGAVRVLLSLLLLTSVFSAAQFTQYLALQSASKNYLVALALIGELEPIFELAVTTLFLGEKSIVHTYVRSLIVVIGVSLAAYLSVVGSSFDSYSFFLFLGSTVAYGLLRSLGRNELKIIPVGLLLTFRSFVGAWLNFGIVLALRGPNHFAGVASNGFVFGWMSVLAVVGVLGTSAFYTGLKLSTAAQVSIVSSSAIFFKSAFAPLIAGSELDSSSYIGLAVVGAGLVYEGATKLLCKNSSNKEVDEGDSSESGDESGDSSDEEGNSFDSMMDLRISAA